MLSGGTLCVCDIVGVLGVSQPKVSRHLTYLRKSGLVAARKDGLWMHYSLLDSNNAFHANLLACIAASPVLVPQLRKDLAKLAKLKRSSCCK